MTRKLPTPDAMRALLRYEPDTGMLFWRVRPESMFKGATAGAISGSCRTWNGRFAGKPALNHQSPYGYLQGRIFGKGIQAHRAAWVVYYGKWPDGDIDHINGVRDDNRIKNMRDVSRAENLRNRCMAGNNTSGVMGVRLCKQTSKWSADITCDGVVHHLGRFEEKEDAVKARKAAEIELGFHANHGRDREGGEPTQERLL